MVDMKMRAHHHVDLVGLDAGCLQPFEIVRLHEVPFRAMGTRLVIADAGIDQDRLAADLQQPAVHAEFQEGRRLVIVRRHEPVAVTLDDRGIPVGKEGLGVEVRFVALFDAHGRAGAELQFDHPQLSPVCRGD
jgi:hypothetical protein